MVQLIDSTLEMITSRESFRFESPNVRLILDPSSELDISLNHWDKAGLRSSISVSGLGHGYYNDEPYPDKETAILEHNKMLEEVKKANYHIEYHGGNKIKLILE